MDTLEWIEDNYEVVFKTIKEMFPEMSDSEIDNNSELQEKVAMNIIF